MFVIYYLGASRNKSLSGCFRLNSKNIPGKKAKNDMRKIEQVVFWETMGFLGVLWSGKT